MKLKQTQFKSKLFLLFFLSVGVHKANYLLIQLVGIDVQGAVSVSLLLLPLLFLVLLDVSSNHSYSAKVMISRDRYLFTVMLLIGLALLVGLINGNKKDIIFQELWTGAIVFYGYKLSKDQSLVDAFGKWPLLIMYLVFSALVFVGSFYLREHLVGYDLGTSIRTATLAYEVSPLLDFWPFLFLIPFFKKRGKLNPLVLLPMLIYLAFQIFFLKRAPSVRALAFLFTGIAISWKLRTGNFAFVFRLFFGIILFGLGFYLLIPDNLLLRFQTTDTARQDEAIAMLNQLGVFELLFGRGIGGSFYLNEGAGLVSLKDGQMGKYILHIGVLYPILKGGIILAIGIYAQIFNKVLWAWRNLKALGYGQLASLTFLVVYSVFRLIEGPISPGVVFDAFLLGFSIGMLRRDYYYSISTRKI